MNRRMRVLLVAAATLLSALTLAATPAAAAAAAGRLSLSANGITVRTANGQNWNFQIYSSQDGQDAQAKPTYGVQEGLFRTVNKATASTESHYWSVPARPSSTLTFSPATGRGKLATSNVLTTINMTFKATGHRNVACDTGSERVYAGTLTGQATLHTGLKHGGTVGGNHLAFKATGASITVDNGCTRSFPTSNACQTSTYYSAFGSQRSTFGFSSSSFSSVSISHSVSVKPAGATRSDSLSAKPAHAPAFDSRSGTLTFSGSSNGVVVGGGKIAGGTGSNSNRPCTVGSKKHTQHSYSKYSAKFTNTAGHPLVGKSSLVGKMTLANGAMASFTVNTWS